MQSTGSLTETNLKTLLESAQSERATGTLNVHNGGGHSCTLYFLFGHLFHAVGEGALGDEAVVKALNWSSGEFDYDPKAKLPADETVRGSIPELVAQAGTSAPAEASPASTPEPAAQPAAEQKPAPAPAPAPESEPEPEPEPQPAAKTKPEPVEPPRPREQPKAEREQHEERKGVKHRPSPKHGREPIPVPAGQVIYDSLKTSFVDFPRLITTLEREGYTGYVRLLTEDAAGLILFKEGAALEAAYDAGQDPTLTLGTQALFEFNEAVRNGEGILDVVALSPELVNGLYELTVAKPLYSDLYASWVDPDALLKFLEKRKLSGSVMVRGGGKTGVIILTEGALTGAYTSDSRDISETAEGVLRICDDREAVIEVKASDGAPHQGLDVDAIVGSRKIPTGTTQVEMPVYRPEAVTPPAPETPAAAPEAGSTQPNMPAYTPDPVQATPSWQPEPQPVAPATPEPAPPFGTQGRPAAPAAGGGNVDWEQVIAELQAVTEEDLGNRARKVKDLLASADRTPAGLEATIDQIPTISILFVDSSRLESLAQKLRAKLHSYLG